MVSIMIGNILTENNEFAPRVTKISAVINNKIKYSPNNFLYLKTLRLEKVINPMKRTPPRMPEYRKGDIKIL